MKRIERFSANVHFPKFSGQIIVSKDTIKFDNRVIIISSTDSQLTKIFELGIIFPELIYGASTRGDKYEFKKDFSADTSIIRNVHELNFPNQKPGTKWFSFLLFQRDTYPRIVNPSLYLFELTNQNADSKMMIQTFIDKAKVTAFGFCSILI